MNTKEKYCYEFPRPALTTDCAVFAKENNQWQILLIQRKHEPYKDHWALPGGFLDMDETVEQCVRRELKEETGIEVENVEQVLTASKVDRDPRGRVISVIFYSIFDKQKPTGEAGLPAETTVKAGDDASIAKWFNINALPELAFDHDELMKMILKRIER